MTDDIVQQYLNALHAALSEVKPDADLTWKNMFGGAGFWVNGQIFAAYFGGGLALKLPEDAREALLKIEDAVQAQSPQYIEVPQAYVDDPKLLVPWVACSVEYALKSKKKKK